MPALRRQDVLVQAARLYYLQNKSQGEIAKTLGLSRSSVSRILAAAREKGIVEVRIHGPGLPARITELEQAIVRRFGVAHAMVVARRVGRAPIDVVAEAAARIFEDQVSRLASFGLSWGRTVDRFVAEVEDDPINHALTVCPLVGGMPSDTGPAGNTSVEVLAQKRGGTSFRFESPSVVQSRQAWATLTSESTIAAAIERAAKVQAALVGIGSFGIHASRLVLNAMALDADEAAEVAGQGAAGDICGRFYDFEGRPLDLPTSQRVIGITLEHLAAIPETVGIAGGVEKAGGVIGALRTGALNGVVLDESLARDVLDRTDR